MNPVAPPLVSVLMPVYNAAPYVEQAIRSILEQTVLDFELLIFNDGSTDESSSVIQSIQDQRIQLYNAQENCGYVAHLNEGLRLARGKYIARMDADDIALPERFAKQVELLENNPSIGLCGTAYVTFGSQQQFVPVPVDDQQVREFMLRDCPMGHPTVMFRKTVVDQYGLQYDRDFMPAEDYRLWVEFSKVSSIQNIPEALLLYRVHPHQISAYANEKQGLRADAVRALQLVDKGFELTVLELATYCQILRRQVNAQTPEELQALLSLMNKISLQNKELRAYDKYWFDKIFIETWHFVVSNIQHYKIGHVKPLVLAPKLFAEPYSSRTKFHLFVKLLLGWKAKLSTESNL